MKRALKKKMKAVLENTPNDDGSVELTLVNPKVNRRVPTKAAMIGLAISMGATSLLVTRQSDQALAAEPVGSEKAASANAASDIEVNAATKLQSQVASTISVPENSVVQPTAISQVSGANWQLAASGISGNIQPQAAQKLSIPSVQATNKLNAYGVAGGQIPSFPVAPVKVATVNAESSEVNAQLKAQQEFAINRLQQKSNRLRESLVQLRSSDNQVVAAAPVAAEPVGAIEQTPVASQQPEALNRTQASLVSKLKQASTTKVALQAPNLTAVPEVSAGYEVKNGDTLAAIALQHRTSVSELVKANNLNNPNQLKIDQKLVIPGQVASNSATQTTVANSDNANFSSTSGNVVSSIQAVPQLPVVSRNRSLAATPTPEVMPSVTPSFGMGGDTPVPKVFNEMQLAKRPVSATRAKNNVRLRTLREEIERLQAKYRSQQSGNPIQSEVSQTENSAVSVPVMTPEAAEIPVPVIRPNRAAVSIPVGRPNNAAIPIAVPRPLTPTYSARRYQPQYRGNLGTSYEPVNPEFVPNKVNNTLAVPPVGTDASRSLGAVRGTTVSPQLPPLAAVDRYLPRVIDENSLPIPSPTAGKAYIWPAKGVLTSGYGWRWGRMHKGIDIANSTGTPIYAVADGVVEKAGWNKGGYGLLVDIRHPNGTMSRYAHNSKLMVKQGQEIRQGQHIANMGNTGFSTGPHSHFEIHKSGKGAVNPIALLPNRV